MTLTFSFFFCAFLERKIRKKERRGGGERTCVCTSILTWWKIGVILPVDFSSLELHTYACPIAPEQKRLPAPHRHEIPITRRVRGNFVRSTISYCSRRGREGKCTPCISKAEASVLNAGVSPPARPRPLFWILSSVIIVIVTIIILMLSF